MNELQVQYTQATLDIVNWDEFQANVQEVVSKYENYLPTAGTINADKDTRATLNKLIKSIDERRKEIKGDFTKPLTEFEGKLKDAVAPLKEVVSKIDAGIKEIEEQERTYRRDAVKMFLANESAKYNLDARIFDSLIESYGNKKGNFKKDGFTLLKKAADELSEIVQNEYQAQEKRRKDISIIASRCEQYGLTSAPYERMLDTFDLSDILTQIDDDKERLIIEQEAKEAREKAQEERRRQALEQAQAEAGEYSIVDNETGEIVATVEPEPANKQVVYQLKANLTATFSTLEEKDAFKELLNQFNVNLEVTSFKEMETMHE